MARVRTNAGAVGRRMEEHFRIIAENANSVVAELAVSFAEDVSEATPVDTGAAEYSWNVTKNSGPVFVSEDSVVITNPSGVRAQARAAVGKTAQRADVTNGATYIGKLNNGTSTQAPAGFVRTALAQSIARLKGVRLLTKNSTKKLSR